MSSMRCSPCDLNYPNWNEHNRCPACRKDTWQVDDDYDLDWKDRVMELKNQRPMPDGDLPDARAEIVEYRDQLWVAHQLLLDAGYSCLEDFGIVKIKGRYYELQGHMGKTQDNLPGGGWWIEEVDPEKWSDEFAAAWLTEPWADAPPWLRGEET